MVNNILTAKNLSCIRSDRELFSGLNFSVETGQILHIKGINGCGKTSLLRILAGLMFADEGEVYWNNSKINSYQYNHKLIYLGHQNGIKAELSVLENLQFARDLKNDNHKNLFDILDTFSLRVYADTEVFKLSAGQKRRVSLAFLLISDCPLWILDEPFTSLDKKAILNLENIFKSHLKNKGMIIFTSHQNLTIINTKILNLS